MKNERHTAFSASPYEDEIGFARAVRIGPIIAVAGCGPVAPDGSLAGGDDPAAQARRCFEIIAENLAKLDARLEDVIRTRMFVTDAAHWRSIAPVHAEVFMDIRPAATIVAVSGFADPRWLVEIEADAYIAA